MRGKQHGLCWGDLVHSKSTQRLAELHAGGELAQRAPPRPAPPRPTCVLAWIQSLPQMYTPCRRTSTALDSGYLRIASLRQRGGGAPACASRPGQCSGVVRCLSEALAGGGGTACTPCALLPQPSTLLGAQSALRHKKEHSPEAVGELALPRRVLNDGDHAVGVEAVAGDALRRHRICYTKRCAACPPPRAAGSRRCSASA